MARWNSGNIWYISKLRAHGFIVIGEGLYASVLYHPKRPDRVIKVSRWDGWPQYILWANSADFGGTFAPQLYHFKSYDWGYVAVMERLACTVQELGQFGPANHDFTTLQFIAKEISINYFPTHDNYPDWQAFVKEAHKNCRLDDVHSGNVMLRSDGQIVLTDPCTNISNRPNRRYSNGGYRLNWSEQMMGLREIKKANRNPKKHAMAEMSDGQKRWNNSPPNAYWSEQSSTRPVGADHTEPYHHQSENLAEMQIAPQVLTGDRKLPDQDFAAAILANVLAARIEKLITLETRLRIARSDHPLSLETTMAEINRADPSFAIEAHVEMLARQIDVAAPEPQGYTPHMGIHYALAPIKRTIAKMRDAFKHARA